MSPHPAALRSLPLATLLATLPWNTLACELPVGRLTAAEGRIEIRTAGSPRWQPATLRQTLCPGDQVAVRGPGRAAVVLGQDVLVRLDQNTTLTLPDGPDAGTMKLPRGVVHVISRFSKRFGVVTPFVNAFVDGTEFTVTAGEDTARVVVAEGRVRTDNREGETRLTAGQAIEARTGSAPAPITMRPLDAVAWAIHYPQVVRLSGTDMADLPESLRAPAILAQQQAARGAFRDALDTLSPLSRLETWPHLTAFKAGILLGLGRSDEAASLGQAFSNAPHASLLATAAIAQVARHAPEAGSTARQAVALDPASPAARLALSYAQQAARDLPAALESAREATHLADDNPLAWARRAELELATADAAAGAASARKALVLAPETPRARSLAAFARLMQGESAGAAEDFQRLISESDADPLARFGLGLALMRQGQTAAGRREVEIAGLLDPSNAELRSYLGRAYLEEDRSKVAGDQFDLARRLDPASPTPWYFEAFRQLREGEPLAAIRNADEALARNDNRAVIRPSVLIDQDRAARSASLGAAYQQVGFVGASEIIALQALQDDPQSPATHRLLADAYADTPRFEGARLSELLQANLRQPIGAWPLAPQFVMSPLPLFDGPRAVTPEEATALFDRKPTRLAATLGAGNNDTRAGSLLASHAWERGQVSFGTFDYQNASINERMAETRVAGSRADLRLALTPAIMLLAEYRHTERSGGSTSQGLFESGPLKTLQNVLNDLGRIALRHTLSASEDLVLEANTQRVRTRDQDLLITDLALDSAGDIRTRGLSLAYSRNTPGHALALGGSVFRMTYDGSATASGFALPSVHTTSDRDSVFSYGQWRIHPALTLHGGAEYARLALPESTHSERINSKLGIVATPREGTTLRGAFFQGISGSKFDRESLAPTQFAGFNQVFDDMAGSRWRRAAVAVDQRFAGGIRAGLELSERRLSSLLGPQLAPWHESLHRAHISIPVGDRFALSAEWRRETFRYEGSEVLSNNPHTLRTDLLPLRLWSRLGSVDTLLEHWVVRQNGKQTSQSSDPMTGPFTTEASARSTFTVTNLRASRPLSGKHLSATLGIYNLFDQQVVMHNADRAGDPRPPLFYPRRTVLLQASLRF